MENRDLKNSRIDHRIYAFLRDESDWTEKLQITTAFNQAAAEETEKLRKELTQLFEELKTDDSSVEKVEQFSILIEKNAARALLVSECAEAFNQNIAPTMTQMLPIFMGVRTRLRKIRESLGDNTELIAVVDSYEKFLDAKDESIRERNCGDLSIVRHVRSVFQKKLSNVEAQYDEVKTGYMNGVEIPENEKKFYQDYYRIRYTQLRLLNSTLEINSFSLDRMIDLLKEYQKENSMDRLLRKELGYYIEMLNE